MKSECRLFSIGRIAVLALSMSLAACSSPVKLDEPAAVTDATTRAPTDVSTGANRPQAAPTGNVTPVPSAQPNTRDVAPVNSQPTAVAVTPPQGVERVVLFDYDSFVIKPEFQGALERHAGFLKSNRGIKVALEGHTDERGGREYNLALGQRRAEAVANALRLLGVADNQTEAVSFGKEKPIASGSDEPSFAKNRRAELFYK